MRGSSGFRFTGEKILFLFGLVAFSPPHLSWANPPLECVVIDTDSDLDDMRAIATLAGSSREIAAIVTTEGIARRKEGKAAIEYFLGRISADKIPVIEGEGPNRQREYEADPRLSEWRKVAETLNGTFRNVAQEDRASKEPTEIDLTTVVEELSPLVKDCGHIELLVIDPWTSFMRYGPELLDRIDLIVAQGRPDPDELEGQPTGFNCTYDLNSCLAAYDLLVGRRQRKDRHLRAHWVDIPQSPVPVGSAEPGVDAAGNRAYPFAPSPAWADDLQKAGKGAAVVAEILLNNPEAWKKTSLWDDLTALYLLRPELFAKQGGHWEPQVKADVVRQILLNYMKD